MIQRTWRKHAGEDQDHDSWMGVPKFDSPPPEMNTGGLPHQAGEKLV